MNHFLLTFCIVRIEYTKLSKSGQYNSAHRIVTILFILLISGIFLFLTSCFYISWMKHFDLFGIYSDESEINRLNLGISSLSPPPRIVSQYCWIMLHKMKKVIPFCITIFKDCFLLLVFLVYFNKRFTVPETVQKTFSKIIIIKRTD